MGREETGNTAAPVSEAIRMMVVVQRTAKGTRRAEKAHELLERAREAGVKGIFEEMRRRRKKTQGG